MNHPAYCEFFTQRLEFNGIPIWAHGSCAPNALTVLRDWLGRMLAKMPVTLGNLAECGVEVHVIASRHHSSRMPTGHWVGPNGNDPRGFGGFFTLIGEAEILHSPGQYHLDNRELVPHELAHMIQEHGLDAALRARIAAIYNANRYRWAGCYAAKNEREYFAELSMWYWGSHGDHAGLPPGWAAGPAWLKSHDPDAHAFLENLYTGKSEPSHVTWENASLQPGQAPGVSTHVGLPTDVLFLNERAERVKIIWIDHSGREHGFAELPAGAKQFQSTFTGHVGASGMRATACLAPTRRESRRREPSSRSPDRRSRAA